ncbi:trypsin-like peptidase domain-containing protein [Streptomyces sp. NBC_01089]|uniref:trypsin-like peptidase domain-containing protein n=1 Tax=Streptomyces sp. NBC_01089 TaxID=2903747 RepID=UPI003863B711|nr:trypsin-like peptidase domain-containing protein [Streptomyces sp. NBC_01089]WSU46272.1 trypsin-like peptidase domain-containing protein [Streptomyces sp. NBC_01089]
MRKPLLATLTAVTLGAAALAGTTGTAAAASGHAGGTTPAAAAAAAHPERTPVPVKAASFAGTVALSNCSGSLIRMPDSQATDPGLVLTNGHCLETGFPSAGQVITDQPSTRSFTLLNATAGTAGTLKANKVVYSTMTDTDVTLYQLTQTYAQIQQSTGIAALTLSAAHPVQGHAVDVVSGYWKKVYSCSVDGFAYRLKEDQWTWKDAVRYTPQCQVIGGTSGSPVIDTATGQVTAVNNTINESGESCTLDNPCEVNEQGTVTIRKGIGYAEETYGIPACFTTGNKLDLPAAGCTLPKPAAVSAH